MGQIIIIEDRKELLELLTLNINTYIGLESVSKGSAAEAREMLDLLPDTPLVICRDKVGQENTAKHMIKYIKQHNSKTKLVVIGKANKENGVEVAAISDPRDWKQILEAASKAIGVPIKEVKKGACDAKYVPIPVNYFLYMDDSCCDIYILIKKSGGSDQYVKLVQKGDTVFKEKIEGYMKKNLKDLYIPSDMQQNVTNFISDRLTQKIAGPNIDSADQIVDEKTMEMLSNAQEIAQKEALKFGITSATLQLVETIINSFIASIESSPSMSKLLRKIINAKGNYLYQKSHIAAVVACEILRNMGKNDKKIDEMIIKAAFFHDIAFSEKEELSKITTQEDFNNAMLSNEDREIVINHPNIAVEIIQSGSEGIEDEVLAMIRHHHGSPDGKGFETDFSKLSGLDKIFFISCEFVKELMNFKTDKQGKFLPVLATLNMRYVDSDIRNVLKALGKTLKHNINKK